MTIYKYTLQEDFKLDLIKYKIYVPNTNNTLYTFRFFEIKDNILIIKKGYSWDGCTPKFKICNKIIGTPDFYPHTYRASLVHDVLYQFRVYNSVLQGKIKIHQVTQHQTDKLFYYLMKEDGFKFAWLYYGVVKAIAWMWWWT